MQFYNQTALGLLLFILYFFITGFWWKEIFESRFFGPQSGLVGKVYGCTAAFLLLGLISSVFVVWYRLTPATITAAYGITALISFFFWHLYAGTYPASHGQHTPDHVYFPGKSVFIFLFVLLWLAGMFFYTGKEGVAAFETPWHVLPHATWIIFFFLSAFIGIFIFSKIKAAVILPLIVLFSFYTHLYIPASHQLPWGGDVWRLIAVEEKLLQGNIEPPVLFGPERTMRMIVNYAVPDALFVPHKYTYGHLWGTSVVMAKTVSVSLIAINKWLVPLLWSIVVPILFYRTGTVLFDSKRKGLLLAWGSSLVFTLQAVGALTLPVSLGTLTFFFAMSILIESIKRKKRAMWPFVLLLSLLMFFGYILHAILFFLMLMVTGLFLFLHKKNIRIVIKRTLYIASCVMALAIIPAIELLSKSGTWPQAFDWQKQLLQMIGQLSGWFYATMIRPHDIVSGNILFNHTPTYASISNAVTEWRYHIMIISLAVWLSAKYGFFKIVLLKKSVSLHLIGFFSAMVIGGYIIGWFILAGDRLFTRRLDPLMAYALLILSVYGIYMLLGKSSWFLSMSLRIKRGLLFVVVLILSWFGTTVWVSGPDLHVTSSSELVVARFIAQDIKNQSGPLCVLADTWILLPLEGLTAGRVVGGGFPIDYQFGQKERVALYKEFISTPTSLIGEKIASVVDASSCYLVLKTNNSELNNELGEPVYRDEAGEMSVWKIGLKKTGE